MEENEDRQSTAEYDLAINGYINLCPQMRWRGADMRRGTLAKVGLLSSRTKLRTGHSKDAVRAGPLDAFSENGGARGEGSEHVPCRYVLGRREYHQ